MPAIAAIQARIIRAFADAAAFDENTAKTPGDLYLPPRFERMINAMSRRGALIPTADGRYYVNKDWYERRRRAQRILLPLALILVAVMLVIVCLTWA